MKLQDNIKKIIQRFNLVSEKLGSGSLSSEEIMKLSKERSGLQEIAEAGTKYIGELAEVEMLQKELRSGELDKEMEDMMKEELCDIEKKIVNTEEEIKFLLIPKDEQDSKNVIIEIRAGAGGDEASLFGFELLEVYKKFSAIKGWKFNNMSMSFNDAGGLKEGIISISGYNVFASMKFESGTHRVQRVPKTENKGRVHTSTVTVAVLPEVGDLDLKINEKDIRVDVFRSSGPGGQSVNTTDSAVRMVHIPTGITVSQQDEKSQIKNREKARKILFSKIYEYEKNKRDEELSKERNSQIGTGDRSEKIRTYNFPQDRITDHRINSNFGLGKIMTDGDITDVIEKLISEDRLSKLAELEKESL